MYVYESHLGGLYGLDYYDNLHLERCETCGDSDSYLGYYESEEEFMKYFSDDWDERMLEELWELVMGVDS